MDNDRNGHYINFSLKEIVKTLIVSSKDFGITSAFAEVSIYKSIESKFFRVKVRYTRVDYV
ncbi:hypothetical protein FIU95_10845 [Microbulbifer sp. THAF38]|nr:hypothetical protein FIU95_10845 [Microbulbifer sp. THAF38]